ncbi:MAG: hypothetical protein VXA07_05135, partial [Halieaceae bacterium]
FWISQVYFERLKALRQALGSAPCCSHAPARINKRQPDSSSDITTTKNEHLHDFTALSKNG